MSVRVPVRLSSVDQILRVEHGSVRQLTATERRVLQDRVRAIELDIENAWPVDTGFSRDGWISRVYGSSAGPLGGIGFIIANDVDYVQWVHRAGERVPLWRRLVRDTVLAHRASLLDAMRTAIRQTEAESKASGQAVSTLLQLLRPRRARPGVVA